MIRALLIILIGVYITGCAGGDTPRQSSVLDFTDVGVSQLINKSSQQLLDETLYTSCVFAPVAAALRTGTLQFSTPPPDGLSAASCANDASKWPWRFSDTQQQAWRATSTAIREKFLTAMKTARTRYQGSNGTIMTQVIGLETTGPEILDGYVDVMVINPTPERPNTLLLVVVP